MVDGGATNAPAGVDMGEYHGHDAGRCPGYFCALFHFAECAGNGQRFTKGTATWRIAQLKPNPYPRLDNLLSLVSGLPWLAPVGSGGMLVI